MTIEVSPLAYVKDLPPSLRRNAGGPSRFQASWDDAIVHSGEYVLVAQQLEQKPAFALANRLRNKKLGIRSTARTPQKGQPYNVYIWHEPDAETPTDPTPAPVG